MTPERIAQLTDTELDEICAAQIMRWHKSGYNWHDGYGVVMAEIAGTHNVDVKRAYRPSANLRSAFELMDYVMQGGYIVVLWNFGDYARVEVIRKRDCKILHVVRNPSRCRAIAEACVWVHIESGKDQPVFEAIR